MLKFKLLIDNGLSFISHVMTISEFVNIIKIFFLLAGSASTHILLSDQSNLMLQRYFHFTKTGLDHHISRIVSCPGKLICN